MDYLSYDPNFTDTMEEDTDEEIVEDDEDEYGLHSFLLMLCFHFAVVGSYPPLNICVVGVGMSTAMMRMRVGKSEGQQQSVLQH